MSLAEQRALMALQRQDYEKQVVAEHGVGGEDFEACGPPTWSRAAWERFRAQYGRWPFSAEEKPPEVLNAPQWVKDICGIHTNPAGN